MSAHAPCEPSEADKRVRAGSQPRYFRAPIWNSLEGDIKLLVKEKRNVFIGNVKVFECQQPGLPLGTKFFLKEMLLRQSVCFPGDFTLFPHCRHRTSLPKMMWDA